MKKRYILPLLVLLFISVHSFAQKSNKRFNIKIQLIPEGADSTGGTIKITRHWFRYKLIESEGGKYPVGLKFNSYYLITCSKPGYSTKVVYFDTHVPRGRKNLAFAKFTVTVNLLKAPYGESEKKKPKPIGGCKYDPEIQDFDKVKNANNSDIPHSPLH